MKNEDERYALFLAKNSSKLDYGREAGGTKGWWSRETVVVYNSATKMAEWKDRHIAEQQVSFKCISKEVTMTVQQLIDYYIEREIGDVADECGF